MAATMSVADLAHLVRAKAARRRRGRAHADAGRRVRRQRIERDRVLVHRDADAVEDVLRLLARDAERRDIDEHQMVVRATGDDLRAVLGEGLRREPGRCDGACAVAPEFVRGGERSATALAAMTCISGPPCKPGKDGLVHLTCPGPLCEKTSPPRGPRSVLCVVVVTRSACGNGLGCCPAATSPAMCAMSTKSSASTSGRSAPRRSKSMIRG